MICDELLQIREVDQFRLPDGQLRAIIAQPATVCRLVSRLPLKVAAWNLAGWVETTIESFISLTRRPEGRSG